MISFFTPVEGFLFHGMVRNNIICFISKVHYIMFVFCGFSVSQVVDNVADATPPQIFSALSFELDKKVGGMSLTSGYLFYHLHTP